MTTTNPPMVLLVAKYVARGRGGRCRRMSRWVPSAGVLTAAARLERTGRVSSMWAGPGAHVVGPHDGCWRWSRLPDPGPLAGA